MSKRYDVYEEMAINHLQVLIDLDKRNTDALPGSVVKRIKEAQKILKRRRPKSEH